MIEALDRHGQRVSGGGRGRSAQCPAHEDRTASLSVTDAESRVLVNCHAGCDTDDVLAELGLTRADLFNEPRQRRDNDDWAPWQRDGCKCKPVARYSYVDEQGELLFQVVRGEHKEFSQRRPDPASRSGWRWGGIASVRRILYHLPQLLAAPKSACVFVAEGEKDVHALEAAGEIATCPPGGAGKWRPEYTEALAGRDVLVVSDRDQPGRAHAWEVLTSIESVTRFAWITQAAAGKDAADHLAAGHGVPDFVWWNL